MAETRPTGDQILIHSSKTGDSSLDSYIENAEQGTSTIGDMLSKVFSGGEIRVDLFQFRESPDTAGLIQFRVGDFIDPNEAWQDISGDSFPDVLAAAIAAKDAAETAAADAAIQAAKLIGTSTTSVSIATGSKSFTTQSGKFFGVGMPLIVSSDGSPTGRIMTGLVTSYSGTSLTINVTRVVGSGSYSDWTIRVSGMEGVQGVPGTAGAGTGDMLKADNLSGLASAAAARTNLGLGGAAIVDVIDEDSFATDSATRPPSQQSTKAYVNTNITSNLRPFYDEDDFASNDATGVASQQSTKAYVDAAVIAASPGLVLIDSKTASASATIDFTTGLNSTYDYYEIRFQNVTTNSGTDLLVRTSSNAGSTFDSGGSDYTYQYGGWNNSASLTTNQTTGSSFRIVSNYAGSRAINGRLEIHNPSNTTVNKSFTAYATYETSSSGMVQIFTYATRGGTALVNAIRFFASSGNVITGTFHLYGYKK